MKKNWLYIVFLALFLGICLIFPVGTWLSGPSEAGANEVLSQPPKWEDKEGNWNDAYLQDAAAWYNDHFYLRQELVSTQRLLTGKVFGTSGEDSVILGKDGWLFYGSTLEDFTGTTGLTQRDIYAMARNLYLMSQEKPLIFLVAPNKNSLYPQYIPDYGVQAEMTTGELLQEQLRQLGVNFVDIYAAFQKEPVLYYATDSHWNQKGAALAADLINQAAGRTTDYYAGPFEAGEPYTGDLYEMLYPAFSGTETDWVYGGQLDFSYVGNAQRPDSITLQTQSDETGSLLVYRDSFGNLLYPYLADSFGSVRFSRSTTYDLTGEEEVVVLELVERNLSYLMEKAPVCHNPTVEITLPEPAGTALLEKDTKANAPEGYVLWQGTLDSTPDVQSSVYVSAGGEVYEAFLLKENGVALYLPEGVQPDTLAWETGGVLESKTISEKG